MSPSQHENAQNLAQMIETDAITMGRKVLGREPTPDEADALKAIFNSAAQALSEGFIRRLADHVLAERREETIEGFFEDRVKTD